MNSPRHTSRSICVLQAAAVVLGLTSSALAQPTDGPDSRPAGVPPSAAGTATAPPGKKSWADRITPDLRTFLYYRLDLGEGSELDNEFGVARAYIGGRAMLTDHIEIRLTVDSKARIQTAENREGAYGVYLKYAYIKAIDVGVKGLWFKLGQAGYQGITKIEELWQYRFLGPVLLDREKYSGSAFLGLSAGYKPPSGHLDLQLSVVNGEGYGAPEENAAKDLQLSALVRPFAHSEGFAGGFVLGSNNILGSYGDFSADDLRLRTGGFAGLATDRYVLLLEINYVRDPTTVAARRAARVAGGPTPLASSISAQTTGVLGAGYGWLDLGLFNPFLNGIRLVARGDIADPDLAQDDDQHYFLLAGLGYSFSPKLQVLLNTQWTLFFPHSGYDTGTGRYPEVPAQGGLLLQVEAKL